MNYLLSPVMVALALSPLTAQEKSLLETDPKGWIDVMPGSNLEGWTRLPIAPDPLDAVSQWKVEKGLLVCEGNRGHDWLRYDKELADFVYHVEFRYTPLEGKPRYNSGIFVRTSADNDYWYQAQIGSASGGYLFGYLILDGAKRRFSLQDQMSEQRVKPAGEWNTVEITARGPVLTLWVNGGVTNVFKYCPMLKGHIGLEGEGFRIEFRNLKLKPL